MAKTAKKAKKSMKKTQARVAKPAVISSTAGLAASMAKTTPSASMTMTKSSGLPNLSEMAMMYLTFLLGNAVVIYGASMIFPSHVVLGTNVLSPFMALLYSSVVLTLIVVGLMPVIQMVGDSMKTKITDNMWMMLYLVINIVSLWGVARMAELLGLGLSSWMVALLLGAGLNIVQAILIKVSMSKSK